MRGAACDSLFQPRISLALLTLLSLSVAVPAQQTQHSITGDNQLWEFGVWGAEALGKTPGEGFGNAHIAMAGFHAGRVVHEGRSGARGKRTLEYTVEFQPLFLVTRPQSVYGWGMSPVGLKWNYAPRGRYRPYLGWNGGAMFTQQNVPPGRTSPFNFTVGGGPGVMMTLSKHQALSADLRFWHLSNGGLGYYNPSYNTIELVIGYHWLKTRRNSAQVSAASTSTTTTHE